MGVKWLTSARVFSAYNYLAGFFYNFPVDIRDVAVFYTVGLTVVVVLLVCVLIVLIVLFACFKRRRR